MLAPRPVTYRFNIKFVFSNSLILFSKQKFNCFKLKCLTIFVFNRSLRVKTSKEISHHQKTLIIIDNVVIYLLET